MSRFAQDCRFAWRMLWRGRAVTGFAVLAFALGIGITVTVFSLFYSVLLRPLPYPNPDELVAVYDVQPACATCPASFEKYVDWRQRSTAFSAMGGSSTSVVIVTGLGDPHRVSAARATWTLADVFQVHPAYGRWFTESEDRPGAAQVVVLTDGYWREHFNADPHAVGQRMAIDGAPHEVIGVMPPSFSHRRADLFVPVARTYTPDNRGNHFLATFARLKPGVTVSQAQQQMHALGVRMEQEYGYNHGIDVQAYPAVVVGALVEPLRVLMGAVCLVLLIACANVANLLLASGLARRRELAVRSALGATRWDLARQLTVESVVLALVGGAAGVLLAAWIVPAFVRLADDILPRATPVHIDRIVLLFALAVTFATGLLCGLWPVMRLQTRTLSGEIREGDVRSGSSSGSRRVGGALVVAEIALAFALLAGAGLLVRSLVGLESRDAGFTSDHLVAFDVSPTGTRYQDDARVREFYATLLPKLRQIGGVSRVGATSHLPMYQFGWNGEVTVEGGNPWPADSAPLVEDRWIGGDYFGAMGIAIVRGRAFDERDREGGPRVAIISQRAADKFWPGKDPIGRHVARGGNGSPSFEVVGVAHDVRSYGLQSQPSYELYVPITQEPFPAMTIVLRTTTSNPTAVMPSVRQIVHAVDPLLPVAKVQTMDAVVVDSVNQPRLLSSVASLFGGLAGVLAAVGIYGVMSYNVRRTRREFGIRLALGADPAKVIGLVARRGLLLGLLGVVIGAGAALLLTRSMQSLLTEVKPNDPLVFALTAAGLIVISLVACYLPARQAARTDPMIVLRVE